MYQYVKVMVFLCCMAAVAMCSASALVSSVLVSELVGSSRLLCGLCTSSMVAVTISGGIWAQCLVPWVQAAMCVLARGGQHAVAG